jgi:hypothetical protein
MGVRAVCASTRARLAVTNLETRLSDASSLLRGDYETVIAMQLPTLQRPAFVLALTSRPPTSGSITHVGDG